MGRRLITLLATLALAASAAGAVAPVAEAQATCGTSSDFIDYYVTGANQIHHVWDYQCGGATGEDFYWTTYLQVIKNGSWATESCDAGPCQARHPSSGWWSSGTEHTGNGSWNIARSINGHSYRVKDVMVFSGTSNPIAFIGPTVNVP